MGFGSVNGHLPELDRLDLDLRRGRVTALLGACGPAKSTLMQLAVGSRAPTAGSIEVLGHDPRKREPSIAHAVKLVSDVHTPPTATLEEILDVLRPQVADWDSDFVDSLIERFEIVPHRQVRRLSRSERMAAHLITAVAADPELLMLDEPFAPIYAEAYRERALETVLVLLGRPRRRVPRTVLLATVDNHEAALLADDIAILDGGAITAHAPLTSVLRAAESPDVRRRQQPVGRGSIAAQLDALVCESSTRLRLTPERPCADAAGNTGLGLEDRAAC
jgi:ABC-2 type transport system ATP-binding protein